MAQTLFIGDCVTRWLHNWAYFTCL